MVKSANFTECGNRYLNDPSLIARWNYSGPVRLLPSNPKTQITYEGCKALCGTGNDWYPWDTSSSFITTWVLPIIGTLLQAPFESNAFWRTLKAIGRWMGSPMASLSYILWNIEVSGKCALFVDMATSYEGPLPDEDSEFACIRDSFYILMNLNQYKMKPLISMTKEAEGLLRIILFSKDLELLGSKKTLRQKRRNLATELRSNRRRGVVPVFISTLWFLFALGLSIQSAFGFLGDNTQAHDLAVGLFMSWFPVLILCSIVDRNPVASDNIQRKLNRLVDLVCISLQDHKTKENFINSFQDLPESQKMACWVERISQQAELIKGNYFRGFAGQGRVRFHYGAAHAILIDIEKAYIADHGRSWLSNERQARTLLVLGQVDRGLVWFDGRQIWQILAAFACVAGTGAGALILSFFTPTVGLSCRSGGYLIFDLVAFALLLSEIGIWIYTSPIRTGMLDGIFSRHHSGHGNEHFFHFADGIQFPGLATSKVAVSRILQSAEEFIVWLSLSVLRMLLFKRKAVTLTKMEDAIRHHFQTIRNLTTRQWTERCWFIPVESFNTIWLVYLIMAQTTGAFVNCNCQSSLWSLGGGYLDFTQWQFSNYPVIRRYWIQGTVISTVFMGLGIIYVVLEWCLQAHLSTENYSDAMRGLKNARRFRRFTFWVRYPASVLVSAMNHLSRALNIRSTSERKTLLWTKECKSSPRIEHGMMSLTTEIHQLPFLASRSGRGSDFSEGKEIITEPMPFANVHNSESFHHVQADSSIVQQ